MASLKVELGGQRKRVKLLEERLREIAIRANDLEDKAFDTLRVESNNEPLLGKGTITMHGVKREAQRIVGLAMRELD